MENAKIVGINEGVPDRYFSYWASKELDVQRNNFTEISGSSAESTLAAILADMQIGAARGLWWPVVPSDQSAQHHSHVAGFIKIGRSVGKLSRPELSAALDSWSTSFEDCMPSNERVSQLVFEDLVLDLAEFMVVYEAPVTPSTSSASVSPAGKPLLY